MHWHLYWVESDGIEDCFVVARNARSACRIEINMNGFDPSEVRATRVARLSVNDRRAFRRENPDADWPGYVYGKRLFERVGAQFRDVDGQEEMLLQDVVYSVEEYAPCCIIRKRTIGQRAVLELQSDEFLGNIEYHEEDTWSRSEIHIITMIGMCLANCQMIEQYISSSFLLGISKQQKRKYNTLNDLRNGWKKKTLGGMLKAIEEAWEIDELFRAALYLFLDCRNKLIHGITTDPQYDIKTRWGQEELVAFLYFFDIQSRIVKRAFRASYYASIEFGLLHWGSELNAPKGLLRKKDKDEIALFFQFFAPKEEAI